MHISIITPKSIYVKLEYETKVAKQTIFLLDMVKSKLEMTYILIENLNKTVLDKTLLDNVSFAVNPGEKIALVAKNGTGKTTLLNILSGKEPSDSGNITMQKNIRVAFLEQEPQLNSDHTINEEIFSSDAEIMKAVREYEESLKNPHDSKRMEKAFDMMNQNNAWEYESNIQEIMKNLKIDSLTGKVSTLSGGQKKRLALAKVLIDNPDFLIMDEPTNHLDLEMIEWLENHLAKEKLTLLLVTHDRYFLDRVCDKILELDRGTIYKHNGNYSYYLEKKELRESHENANIDKTKALLKKELVWIKRQPQGRQTKAEARVDAYYKTKDSLKEKIVNTKVELDIRENRLGGKILEIFNLKKSFGNNKILDQFSYSFKRGEKIGIIGNNGVGKSTFLNILMNLENSDSGNIVVGETVKFGYYSQSQIELDQSLRVIDTVKKIASIIKLSNGSEITATQMLERFLFSKNDQNNFVSNLSGGEKKRLFLLTILMNNPNFLILDEPTNDFDLMTLEVLQEFLMSFKGCLIVISHDRYFMDNVVDQLFVFKGQGEIEIFAGNYSEYRNSQKTEKVVPQSSEINFVPTQSTTNSSKESNELYREISKLEKKKATLTKKIFDLGDDYEQMAKVSKEIELLDEKISAMNDQWLELTL